MGLLNWFRSFPSFYRDLTENKADTEENKAVKQRETQCPNDNMYDPRYNYPEAIFSSYISKYV